MSTEAVEKTRRHRRWLVVTTGAVLLVLSAGSVTLSWLGIAADWIGWTGLFLAPVSITTMMLGLAGPMDPSDPPPNPLQVLNNCQ